MSLTYQGII